MKDLLFRILSWLRLTAVCYDFYSNLATFYRFLNTYLTKLAIFAFVVRHIKTLLFDKALNIFMGSGKHYMRLNQLGPSQL